MIDQEFRERYAFLTNKTLSTIVKINTTVFYLVLIIKMRN